MSWFGKNKGKRKCCKDCGEWADFEKSKNELILELSTAKADRDHYKARLEAFEESVHDEPMIVDFDRMDVVSVERLVQNSDYMNNSIATVLGYKNVDKDGNTEIKEWTLHCNSKNHEQLVKMLSGRMGATEEQTKVFIDEVRGGGK